MKKRAISKGSVDASELTPERRAPSSIAQVLEEVLRSDVVVFVIDAVPLVKNCKNSRMPQLGGEPPAD